MLTEELTTEGLKAYPDRLIEAYLEYLKNGTDYTPALNRDRMSARQKIREYISRKVRNSDAD